MINVFPQHKLLHERASVLHYAFGAWLLSCLCSCNLSLTATDRRK